MFDNINSKLKNFPSSMFSIRSVLVKNSLLFCCFFCPTVNCKFLFWIWIVLVLDPLIYGLFSVFFTSIYMKKSLFYTKKSINLPIKGGGSTKIIHHFKWIVLVPLPPFMGYFHYFSHRFTCKIIFHEKNRKLPIKGSVVLGFSIMWKP